MGRFTLDGDSGVSRLEMVSRSTLVAGDVTVVVVRVGELSTSISWLVAGSGLEILPRDRVSLSPPLVTKQNKH